MGTLHELSPKQPYEYYPTPETDITAEEILMKLLGKVSLQWNGKGVQIWADNELKILRSDEQLRLFKEKI